MPVATVPQTEPTSGTPKQPDISYHPDRVKWEARRARHLAADPSLPVSPLPSGFPASIDSPLVWEGKDWKNDEWVYELNKAELQEIDDALRHFHGLGLPPGHLSPATFPLPTLGSVLRDVSTELHTGRGFAVLRGLPVNSSYPRADIILIYAGISSYVGGLRGLQDSRTHAVLAHITDLSRSHAMSEIGAPAYTTDRQVFHTDVGDVIALLALDTAAEGGVSRIGSTGRVYNELAKERPDLVRTLAEPWVLDPFSQELPASVRPLLFYENGRLIIQYARRYFTGFGGLQRSTTIPPLTEAQAEALDTLEFTAEKYALDLHFQPGDIQYVNNLSVFHAREGFRDDGEHKRHLLRLWLRDEERAWSLPEALEPNWRKLYYSIPPELQRFPVEAEIRGPARGNTK